MISFVFFHYTRALDLLIIPSCTRFLCIIYLHNSTLGLNHCDFCSRLKLIYIPTLSSPSGHPRDALRMPPGLRGCRLERPRDTLWTPPETPQDTLGTPSGYRQSKPALQVFWTYKSVDDVFYLPLYFFNTTRL